MVVTDEDADLDQTKPMKVNLPLRQHIQLHTLKLITGKNMSQTVQAAIEMYIDAIREDEDTDADDLMAMAVEEAGGE